MPEVDFKKIAARGGSVESSFEELCCQLAARTRPRGTSFERFRGAGGDGGVECYIKDTSGDLIGWQCKYVFDIGALLTQTAKSLETALEVHKHLTRYVVCFPFDLTGKTERKGKSQSEKFEAWAQDAVAAAALNGRALTIERRSAHDLRQLLLEIDASGGIRHYFFDETILSDDWFADHLASAMTIAGPRYNAQINLQTAITDWFASFGERPAWRRALESCLDTCRQAGKELRAITRDKDGNASYPAWSDHAYALGIQVAGDARRTLDTAASALACPSEAAFHDVRALTTKLVNQHDVLDGILAKELNTKHGESVSESKRFRTVMAEYHVSFPAANLDTVRSSRRAWQDLLQWLESPSGSLAFASSFVLTGKGGAGKTHSLCDIGNHRLAEGAYTCIAFGHQFSGGPDPWTRLNESLGLPSTLGRDGLLDALEAAANCSGSKLLICIDAVNETVPRSYWHGRLSEFVRSVTLRPNLKLCISCRTSFQSFCVPLDLTIQAVEHQGFAGMERAACNAFFEYYGLQPPLVPVLQPELSNPLYLNLVCRTLRDLGLTVLPQGWSGITPVIRAMLGYKETEFARDFSVSPGAAIVSGSLIAIAGAIASTGNASIKWSDAQRTVASAKPQSRDLPVVEWLVTADLLIEDGPTISSLGAESVVRPAFERFGDFLVASSVLDEIGEADVRTALQPGGTLAHLTVNPTAVQDHAGLLTALSILLPESRPGMELSDLVEESIRHEVALLVVRALPWRTHKTFQPITQRILRDVLNSGDSFEAMDSVLAVAAQESHIDAYWLQSVLESLPFAKRDSFWCAYLRGSYENNGIVRRMIDAARDIELERVDKDVLERWCIVLVWFTAAADRRVKDSATRAAVDVLIAYPSSMPGLVTSLLRVDDDEVRERMLLIAYGALIRSPDSKILRAVSAILLEAYKAAQDEFQNAIIRDHIRCIGELAKHRGCLDEGLDPLLPSERNLSTPLPKAPSEVVIDERAERGAAMVKRSCLDDDFNHYSIECLGQWHDAFNKPQVGRWIADRVVNAFGYRESRAEAYDNQVVHETGGGRSKPAWAERIGKKYQWVAMYQLASLLHDSVPAKKDPYERTTGRAPLILLEERKMDPTVRPLTGAERRAEELWWVGQNVDLAATKQLDYPTWMNLQDDLASIERLLGPFERDGQRWLPLACYPTWSEYRRERDYDEPYRSTWMHLEAYVVPDGNFDRTIHALTGRNFFGRWLPEGAHWLHVFVGEYPWASACNIETDDWRGFKGTLVGTNIPMIRAHNEVNCEWEYDGSLPHSVNYQVPARFFFDGTELWWDGTDGYMRPDGRSVFRDPSASEGGPSTLLADLDYLLPLLKERGFRLLWTLLGEKQVLGERRLTAPQVTFSQLAYLNLDGTIVAGERVFFDDYNKNTGVKPRRYRAGNVLRKRSPAQKSSS